MYLTLIRMVSTMHFNSKAISTNNTNYSDYIKCCRTCKPIIGDPYHATCKNSGIIGGLN